MPLLNYGEPSISIRNLYYPDFNHVQIYLCVIIKNLSNLESKPIFFKCNTMFENLYFYSHNIDDHFSNSIPALIFE